MREAVTGGRWSGKLTYSPAVKVGNLLFISGTLALNDDLEIVGVGDIVAQTRQIYRVWQRILNAAGASFSDVVQTTDFVVSLEHYSKTAEVRREFFDYPYPAATGVKVAGLVHEDALIEIQGIAVVSIGVSGNG